MYISQTTFMDIACADEATGLDAVVDPWLAALWREMAQQGLIPDCDDTDDTVEACALIEDSRFFAVLFPASRHRLLI